MEHDLFEPVGGEAEWKVIYKRLRSMEIDQVITYEELSDLLGRPFLDARNPYYRAKQELERHDSRTLANVPGEGYRVVHPTEHERLAKGHVRKSHRQLTKAKDQVDSANREGLDHEARRRLDAMSVHLSSVNAVVKRLNRKVSENDERLQQVREQVKANQRTTQEDLASIAERVDYVTALLEKHGIKDVKELTS